MLLLNFTTLAEVIRSPTMKSLPHQNSLLFWLILFVLIVTGTSALANGISGTYVGKGDNIAVLIQIVQTNDGNLTGRYEQVVLQPNGKIDDMNAAIVGATDGQTVAVTINPNGFLTGNIVVSGTIQGGMLHITGGGNGSNLTLNLLKSDEAEFRSQVAILNKKANEINDFRMRLDAEKSATEARERIEQQKRDFIGKANELIQSMQDKNKRIDKALEYLLQKEAQYHAIMSKARSYLERVQRLPGYNNGNLRNQVIAAMNKGVADTNHIYSEVQYVKDSYRTNIMPILEELAQATHNCPAQDEMVNDACHKLHDPGEAFRAKCKAVVDVLNRLEKTYQTEQAEQLTIISKASQIQ